MNHPEEFTKTTPNYIIKWVLKERQQRALQGRRLGDERLEVVKVADVVLHIAGN